MRQEAEWFESFDILELPSRISKECLAIQNGTSEKFALILQGLAMSIAGFAVAFFISWRFALVCLGVFPFFFQLKENRRFALKRFGEYQIQVYAVGRHLPDGLAARPYVVIARPLVHGARLAIRAGYAGFHIRVQVIPGRPAFEIFEQANLFVDQSLGRPDFDAALDVVVFFGKKTQANDQEQQGQASVE